MAALTKALQNNKALGRELCSLVLGQPVQRDTYVQLFGPLVKELKVGEFLSSIGTLPRLPNVPVAGPFTNSIGMSLKLIPAGELQMGSSDADVTAAVNAPGLSKLTAKDFADEQPQHRVQITKAFYMAAHETTQTQYEQIMGANPSSFSTSGTSSSKVSGQTTSRFPVEKVSWFDAVEFCNKLSAKENLTPCYRLTGIERSEGSIKKATVEYLNGTGYRLPTEAEWEYACRAGTKTPFHFGSRLNGEEANVDGNSPFGTTTKGPYKERPTTVGSYTTNAFGLYDMHGNVWEWCQDWYDENYYAQRVERDPQGATSGENRVLRGGSWGSVSWLTRSAVRGRLTPDLRDLSHGFRVVCVSGPRT